jgi:predicted PurR-regulated permease PerM
MNSSDFKQSGASSTAAQPENGRTETSRTQTVRGNIIFAFVVVLALCLAYFIREILMLLYVSALGAVVLTPVIRGIMRIHIGRRHPGRATAITLLILAVGAGATLFFSFALPPVVRDLREFMKELPARGPQLLGRLRNLPFASHLDVAALNAKVQGFASNLAEYIFLSISDWASKLADIVTVFVLTIYFMLEGEIAYHWVMSFFPLRIRTRLDRTLMRAEVRMGKWLLAQGLLMLILGLLSTIVFVALKIRYAYALGVLMGALNIIPVVGGMVSMALVLIVAAIDSWGKVIGASTFYLIYAQVENSYLTPRIMKSSVDLAGLAVLVALLMGSKLAGVVGAMIAVPTAVLVAVLVEEYLVQEDAKHEALERPA